MDLKIKLVLSEADVPADVVICPANITVESDPGKRTVSVDWNPGPEGSGEGDEWVLIASSAVNTDPPELSPEGSGGGNTPLLCQPDSGAEFETGSTDVVCYSPDANSNATCVFQVTVKDVEPPQIKSCPGNITLTAHADASLATISWQPPEVADNSGEYTTICDPVSGGEFPIGLHVVTCTARDSSGNVASCHFNVNIQDSPPLPGPLSGHRTCPEKQTKEAALGQSGAIVTWEDPIAYDEAGPVDDIYCFPPSGYEFGIRTTPVVCGTMSDSGGVQRNIGWDILERSNIDPNEGQAFVSPESRVPYKGLITHWSVYAQTANPMRALIWRQVNRNPDRYQVVGINELPAASAGERFTHNVPVVDRIYVQSGDMIGWSSAYSVVGFDWDTGNRTHVVLVGPNLFTQIQVRQQFEPRGNGEFREYSINARLKPLLDCNDLRDEGYTEDGVYTISTQGIPDGVEAYCDMKTASRGWIVFQKRFNGSVNFSRDWNSYASGFGSLSGEFWWGNTNLHQLMSYGIWMLRVEVEDWDGNAAYAQYQDLIVGTEAQKFSMLLGGFINGTAGDALANFQDMRFSTPDSDNDASLLRHCARDACNGGFWYRDCCSANPNGQYYPDSAVGAYPYGILWNPWKSQEYSMKSIQMKLSKVDSVYGGT